MKYIFGKLPTLIDFFIDTFVTELMICDVTRDLWLLQNEYEKQLTITGSARNAIEIAILRLELYRCLCLIVRLLVFDLLQYIQKYFLFIITNNRVETVSLWSILKMLSLLERNFICE